MNNLNEKKICFISCVNDDIKYSEALLYIKKLNIPIGMKIEFITVRDADSMCEGYQRAMLQSDAKYKIYCHQDLIIHNNNFLLNLISLFKENNNFGIVGMIGSLNMNDDGMWFHGDLAGAMIDTCFGKYEEMRYSGDGKYNQIAAAMDGCILATQYDVNWRCDLFKHWHFYDVSQCFEFRRNGYKAVIMAQPETMCIHKCGKPSANNYDESRNIFLKEYIADIMLFNKKNDMDVNFVNRYYKVKKVLVDLSKYNGKDKYSDGNIEDEILESVKRGNTDEILHKDNRWPIVYHLTPNRYNLLDAVNFKPNADTLEIGCGCGAITGILCQKSKSVTAVEISPRRAEIAAYRNQEYSNLKICVGNLNDMNFQKKFDYVTLIGVLEYAGAFTDGNNPWQCFLESCTKFLKPDGILIIAIENRLGLKYWCGAREDHNGKYFDGILGYKNEKNIRTFARNELKNLLISVGLDNSYWMYPHPDYKLPTDLYSDSYIPNKSQLAEAINAPYDCNRIHLFPEDEAFASIIDAGLYSEFANSFLVLASRSNIGEQPIYVHHGIVRKDSNKLTTAIFERNGKRYVRKIATSENAKRHLKIILENCRILSEIYGKEHVAQSVLIDDNTLEMEYIEGENFSNLAIQALHEGGVEGLAGYIQFFCENLLKGTSGMDVIPDFDYTSVNRKYNFDLSFANIVINNGNYVIIDYEWLIDKCPAKYIIFRVLKLLYCNNRNDMKEYNIDLGILYKSVGITREEEDRFLQWDIKFYSLVLDEYMRRYQKKIMNVDLNKLNIY
jgi:SAM-dependent methyltransferase